jgi:hypothetical protein
MITASTIIFSPICVPVVHANGTARQTLLEDQLKIIQPLRDAIAAMRANGPHGRDFLTDYQGVREEWLDRVQVLAALLEVIEMEAMAIADGELTVNSKDLQKSSSLIARI